MKLKLFVLGIFVLLQSCSGQHTKINGISYVSSGEKVTQDNIIPIKEIQSNYAAIMPFGFIKSLSDSKLHFNEKYQWFGETEAGITQYATMLKKNNVKIMLKPQIWIAKGMYTGYLKLETESQWNTLEEEYKKFILLYARVAESLNIEILCIGTELEQFVVNRPQYWKELINDIKGIYKGKLTYAANWDEYKRVPFWKELDFIGIDAYYPVSEEKTPTVEVCIEGWKPWKKEIQMMSDRYKKQVLFTEFGYRSVDYTGKEPWKSDRSMNTVNLDGQVNATKALFETFWNEPWFAGGFVWKWFIDHNNVGGENNSRFTPQNKPVEKTIQHYFKAS